MNTRGGDAPPANGGEFLLQLLRKPSSSAVSSPSPSSQPPPHGLPPDPAVAAIGPTIPALAPRPGPAYPPNGLDFPYQHSWHQSTPPLFAPHHHFQQSPSRNPNPNLTPDLSSSPGVLGGYVPHQLHLQSNRIPMGDDARKLGPYGDNYRGSAVHRPEQGLVFGSLGHDMRQNVAGDGLHHNIYGRNAIRSLLPEEGLGMDRRLNGFPLNATDIKLNAIGKSAGLTVYEQERSAGINNWREETNNGSYRAVAAPPGFSKNVRDREFGYGRRASERDVDKGKAFSDSYKNDRSRKQLDPPAGPSAGSNLQLSSGFDAGASKMEMRGEFGERGEDLRFGGGDKVNNDHSQTDIDDLEDQIVVSLVLEDESGEKSDKMKSVRNKDYRSDKRGQWIMSQKMRNMQRHMLCRGDINKLNAPFLVVYESLIPADEEKDKQRQLLMLLEKIITKEWPGARLYLYGSCANSFGFSKSDIDVCLTMEPGNIDKAEVVLKLAEILQSDNLQNVQALTRARVPVVKLMDSVTGISCDICINNILAVANTKLLRDYAQIDVRLRQLAFIVKHWAKSRGVNQTYQGTLSSYAYVLMCIHFLQQRRPAILPCLQRMETTYFVELEDVECAYFDQVEKLQNFGSRNRESIAQLVWAFFHYWAYCHDYANDVISVRMGSTLSKRGKDWTRRVGNDRHLICIEDPFEVTHDLGRVVDKYSIRVLREEFERAAEILQHDPNPTITLFEPYVPQ